jgi:CRISPR-associated protein Cas6
MFWQDDDDNTNREKSDVIDLLFDLQCREIPVDHAHALSTALREHLPEIGQESSIGVHTIHVAGSQNGWERPEFSREDRLLTSRRTKLTLRVPRERVEEIRQLLHGKKLRLENCEVTIGKAKEKELSKQGTIFSRYVQCLPDEEEMDFLERMAGELRQHGIKIRKALCGKTTMVYTPEGEVATRSLMLADLKRDESLLLQEVGLGPGREMGLGIFIPHKGIEAVKKLDDEKE